MAEHITITTAPLPPSKDFNLLRREAINEIARLAGDVWTDHNSHDPGITILEQICFAMTDLGYRLSFPVKDLLTPQDTATAVKQFYTAKEALYVRPLTANDYRRLLIDTDGVKNAWIETVKNPQPALYWNEAFQRMTTLSSEGSERVSLRGFYRAILEVEEGFDADGVKNSIKALLHENRNLCEDFAEIIAFPPETIQVRGAFDLERDADPDAVLAKIHFELEKYVSPEPEFYSLEQMRALGFQTDGIYNGPCLANGFLPDSKLDLAERRRDLRVSDMFNIILDMPEVKTIRDFSLTNREKPKEGDWKDWALELSTGRTPKLADLGLLMQTTEFYRRGVRCFPDESNTIILRDNLETAAMPPGFADIPVPKGSYRNLRQYSSVQYEFPALYGIGGTGLPESASDQRKAGAKQLQAFLMFFDQILANYHEQLEHAKGLFAVKNDSDRTFFSQTLEDEPGAQYVFTDDYKTDLQEITEEPDSETNADRRNRFLNHLLARMGEAFSDRTRLKLDMAEYLDKKREYLKESDELGAHRVSSFDYTASPYVLSGFERKIRALLGIKGNEKFYAVEHILLSHEGTRITGFEKQGDKTLCKSANHCMENDTVVEIFSAGGFDGEYRVLNRANHEFEIHREFDARWIPVHRHPVTGFADNGKGETRCESPGHGLKADEIVRLYINEEFRGKWKIVDPTAGHFDIERPFHADLKEKKGEWRRNNEDAIASFFVSGGQTTCKCGQHGLSAGETVTISAGGVDAGEHAVHGITDEHNFVVDSVILDVVNKMGTWKRVFNNSITGFSLSGGETVCSASGHGCLAGDGIEVFIAGKYMGKCLVTSASGDSFNVDKVFDGRLASVKILDEILTEAATISTPAHGLEQGNLVEMFTGSPAISRGKFKVSVIEGDADRFRIDDSLGTTTGQWRLIHGFSGIEYGEDDEGIFKTECFSADISPAAGDEIEVFIGSESAGNRTVGLTDPEKGSFNLTKSIPLNLRWKTYGSHEEHEANGFIQKPDSTVLLSEEHGLAAGDLIELRMDGDLLGRFFITLEENEEAEDQENRFSIDEALDFDVRWRSVGDGLHDGNFFPEKEADTVTAAGHNLHVGDLLSVLTQQEHDAVYRVTELHPDNRDKFAATKLSGGWGLPKEIAEFYETTDADGDGRTTCKCGGHDLAKGDKIRIFDSPTLTEREYEVVARTELEFTINEVFDAALLSAPNTKWSLISPVEKFVCNAKGGTTCFSHMHGLNAGDVIKVFDTGEYDETGRYLPCDYDGEYEVVAVEKDSFDMDKTFDGAKKYAKEIRDPYSLRLTLVFPARAGRFAKPEFRDFVADVARRKTPAHILCGILWLDDAAMPRFEADYNDWLNKKRVAADEVCAAADKVFQRVR